MSYIPDCRTDENYNYKNLTPGEKTFIDGFDFCAEGIPSALENIIDNQLECDVRPSDVEIVIRALGPELLAWLESDRNEAITDLIDGHTEEE